MVLAKVKQKIRFLALISRFLNRKTLMTLAGALVEFSF